MNECHDNSGKDDRPQDFWEDNAEASSSFQFPFFDECPFLKSDIGKFLAKEIERRIKLAAIRLAAVISSLPEDQRQIYLLYTYKRKTFREITLLFAGHDHKWVIRRFNEAVAAIEKAMPRPMGHENQQQTTQFPENQSPSTTPNRGQHTEKDNI